MSKPFTIADARLDIGRIFENLKPESTIDELKEVLAQALARQVRRRVHVSEVVYVVEDQFNSPGRILAITTSSRTAGRLAAAHPDPAGYQEHRLVMLPTTNKES